MERMSTSNDALAASIRTWDAAEVHGLIGMLHSTLSPTSQRLAKHYPAAKHVPAAGTEARGELAEELVNLLGWYGANALAYGGRRLVHGDGAPPYLRIARDVARSVERNRPRTKRRALPRVASAEQLEQFIVESLVDQAFTTLSTEDLVQVLQESGMDHDAAINAVRRYGPTGLGGAALRELAVGIGKRTFTQVLEKMLVAWTKRYLGKEAATQLARRIITRWPQKAFLRAATGLGWALVVLDAAMFLSSPARRITGKAVPYIAIVRMRRQLLRDAHAGDAPAEAPPVAIDETEPSFNRHAPHWATHPRQRSFANSDE